MFAPVFVCFPFCVCWCCFLSYCIDIKLFVCVVFVFRFLVLPLFRVCVCVIAPSECFALFCFVCVDISSP